MRIGVTINGVLRNYLGQIEKIHTKYFPPEEGEEGISVLDYNLENWVKFPVEESEQVEISFNPDFNPLDSKDRDSVKDLDLEKVEDSVTLDEFLYEKCTLEVFGSADEVVPHAVNTLNNLILKYPEHEFVLLSREVGLSVPSTYFFLSKTSCSVTEVKFVMDSTQQWDHVDLLITDHPDVINSKPFGKTCVVVNRDFNKDLNDDYRVESIKELDTVLENVVKSTQL